MIPKLPFYLSWFYSNLSKHQSVQFAKKTFVLSADEKFLIILKIDHPREEFSVRKVLSQTKGIVNHLKMVEQELLTDLVC